MILTVSHGVRCMNVQGVHNDWHGASLASFMIIMYIATS